MKLHIARRRTVAALAAAAVALTTAVTTLGTAQAAPSTISSVTFDDQTLGTWTASGSPALTYVDEGAGKALAITRAADYEGIQSPTGILTEGVEYTFSMRARLPEGSAVTSTAVRFVVKPAYTWVGNTTLTSTDWTTVTGAYSLPAGTDPATVQVYLGSDDQASGPYTILVDDLSITGEVPPPPAVTVTAADFDDETLGTWSQSGGPALAYVDEGAGKALSITRAADYEGIQSPTGLLTSGVVYTFSMRARLPEGSAVTSTAVRFVVKPDYTWVGNTTLTSTEWTTVTGEFTLPAEADPAAVQVYVGSDDQPSGAYTVLVDDVAITAPDSSGPGTPVDLAFGFEDGTLQGWFPRDAGGNPTLAVTDAEAHGGSRAAQVSDRDGQGDGLGYDVTGVFESGQTYDISAWVKMAAGEAPDDIWLSAQRTTAGADAFDTVGQFSGITANGWTQVTASYTMAGADTATLYFETSFNGGGAGSFLVDDITIRSEDPREIQDLTPLKDTIGVPVGVAIDSRETIGAPAELTLKHFNQITGENHMKVEAWYDDERAFRMHPEAITLMDFAQANDLRVYGHVLLWHSQTPAWFFQDDAGEPLTTSEADKQFLRDRLRTHIDNIGAAISARYGPFGSATNPLGAWDVVNEVVNDGSEFSDGLRRSEWYRILGEEFIDLAFVYANETFNGTYAAPGTTHPVTLFINDYNTDQGGKQDRYFALVSRLLARGVPLDGVGHQFHVSLSTPVANLGAALDRFATLPVIQAVTELDVTVGTPVTEPNLIEQGYYYRDAFEIFRAHVADLYCVTVWGLDDPRSWRSEQAPLMFDRLLQAKPAYYGAAGQELPARILSALSFGGTVPLDAKATTDPIWQRLPLVAVGDSASFQTRWTADHLTVYVTSDDPTTDPTDGLTFVLGDQTYRFARSGSGDVPGVVSSSATGWKAVVHLPLAAAAEGSDVQLDVAVTDGATTTGWNSPGATGTVTLVEPLSYTEVVQATTAPTVDATVDAQWASATTFTTDKQVQGSADGAATATVRTLWSGTTLYVLAEVADDQIDVTASNPWEQDSIELFVDAGNLRNGPYRYDDTQIRINADNVLSFGTGDEAFQAARVTSATATTATGYVVEAAISLLEAGGLGTFHGLDVQVNDGTAGARTSVRMWADPTGLSYQNTSRWGVARLIEAPYVPKPAVDVASLFVVAGQKTGVAVTGYLPGEKVRLTLVPVWVLGHQKSVTLATVTADSTGAARASVTIPKGTRMGLYEVKGVQGTLSASDGVVVLPGVHFWGWRPPFWGAHVGHWNHWGRPW
jgi:endo-1,4-beta-xylanase